MKLLSVYLLCAAIVQMTTCVVSAGTTWQRQDRGDTPVRPAFHSTQGVALPTAETVGQHLLLFEISHRFLPHFSDGHDVLWGLDGPANIRFSFGYGITERLMLTVGRTNENDNYDLIVKYGAWRLQPAGLSVSLALQGGASWNTEVAGRKAGHNRNFQFFGQVVVNALLGQKLAVGVVPSLLDNYAITSEERERMLTLGWYAQYRVTPVLKLIAEWNIAEAGFHYPHDAISTGFVLETGGHFFKVYATNTTSVATTLYLPGTNESADPENWHLGFTITRLLKL